MTTDGTGVSTATGMSTARTRAAMMSTVTGGVSTMTGPRVSLSGGCPGKVDYMLKGGWVLVWGVSHLQQKACNVLNNRG